MAPVGSAGGFGQRVQIGTGDRKERESGPRQRSSVQFRGDEPRRGADRAPAGLRSGRVVCVSGRQRIAGDEPRRGANRAPAGLRGRGEGWGGLVQALPPKITPCLFPVPLQCQ